MNKVKTIVNPQTGMMETVEDTSHSEDAKAKLDRTKRELREMLHGTGQIPVPELVPPVVKAEETEERVFDPSRCTCSHPPHRPPCSYCESGYELDANDGWEEFGGDI